jgi:protein-S-isoprenylcysteine O-methyltransferase Ste14
VKRAFRPEFQLVLLAVAVLGFGSLHIVHWASPARYFGIVILLSYTCWPLLESSAIRQETGRSPTQQDNGTYVMYALARLSSVVITVAFASTTTPPWWQILCGGLLLAAGIVLRTAAIRTLGVQYSNRVRWTEHDTVISSGPYRAIRHPSYTGMLLGHLGLAVGIGSLPGLAAVFLLLLPAIIRRINVEESVLSRNAEWSAFAASRSRLVPWLW